MRFVTGILLILGTPWALIAWIMIAGGPAALFEEATAGRWKDVAGLLVFWPLFTVHICVGYFIWWRWLNITLGHREASRRFWLVAAGHHFVWILLAVLAHLGRDSLPPLIVNYAVYLFVICIFGTIAARVRNHVPS